MTSMQTISIIGEDRTNEEKLAQSQAPLSVDARLTACHYQAEAAMVTAMGLDAPASYRKERRQAQEESRVLYAMARRCIGIVG